MKSLLVALLLLFGASGVVAAVLRNEDVLKMANAGLPDSTIIAAIRANECRFELGSDEIIELKNAGVSAPVLEAMLLGSSDRQANPSAQREASSPSLDDFVAQLRLIAQDQSQGVAEVLSLEKTNGKASVINGVPNYWLAFQLTVGFREDCRWLYVHIDSKLAFRVAVRDPKSQGSMADFAFVGTNPGIALSRGDIMLVDAEAYLEKTERGWMISRLSHKGIRKVAGDVLRKPVPKAATQPRESEPARNIELPLSHDQFARQLSDVGNLPPSGASRFTSKTGAWSCVPPGASLSEASEIERDGQTIMRFATRGATRGGVDGDMIAISFRKRFGLQLRAVTNEDQLEAETEALQRIFGQFVKLHPVRLDRPDLAGGYALFAGGFRDGKSFAYATSFHVSKKRRIHVNMYARSENFAEVWEEYKKVLGSLKVTLND